MKNFPVKIARLTLAFCFAFVVTVNAASGEREIAGEVIARAADAISISIWQTKKTETFAISIDTTVFRGRETTSLSDVKIGELALIHAKKNGDEQIAVSITTRPAR